MHLDQDRYTLVRAELIGLTDSMRTAWRRGDTRTFLARLSVIRARARRHHFHALVDLLSVLERTLQNIMVGRGNTQAISCYLDRIEDAMECREADAVAREVILASVAVRHLW